MEGLKPTKGILAQDHFKANAEERQNERFGEEARGSDTSTEVGTRFRHSSFGLVYYEWLRFFVVRH